MYVYIYSVNRGCSDEVFSCVNVNTKINFFDIIKNYEDQGHKASFNNGRKPITYIPELTKVKSIGLIEVENNNDKNKK